MLETQAQPAASSRGLCYRRGQSLVTQATHASASAPAALLLPLVAGKTLSPQARRSHLPPPPLRATRALPAAASCWWSPRWAPRPLASWWRRGGCGSRRASGRWRQCSSWRMGREAASRGVPAPSSPHFCLFVQLISLSASLVKFPDLISIACLRLLFV